MLTMMLAAQIVTAQADVPVVYRDVPRSVERIGVYRWTPAGRGGTVGAMVRRAGAVLSVDAPAKVVVIVQFHRSDGSYLLDGPFPWPLETTERHVEAVWRRTVTGAPPPGEAARPPLAWLSATAPSGPWPACPWGEQGAWECVGVPLDASGIVVGSSGARLQSTVVTAYAAQPSRASAWGRLLIARDEGGGLPPQLQMAAAHLVDPPRRAKSIRVEAVPLADIHSVPMGGGAVWIAGESTPPDAWIEVRSARSGPRYLPLPDVAAGSPMLPLEVTLAGSRALDAAIVSQQGMPAPGALVAVFRLADTRPSPVSITGPPRRRVLVAETVADVEGAAHFDGLGESDYEIVAWHPEFGRASAMLGPDRDRASVRLQSSGTVRGRILVRGKPVRGVAVISVPDPALFAMATDPLDAKGGDARTGSDGRFVLALAPGGGGELRVDGGMQGVRRVPLPRPPPPVLDLGDIELGGAVTVVITLDQYSTCELRAVGPIGHAGLQVVAASRSGPGRFTAVLPEEGAWAFNLACGAEERELSPGVVRIQAAERPQEVRLSIR